MATQTGPRLTIVGTCEGCCHLRSDTRHPVRRFRVTTCAHAEAPFGRGAIIDLEGQGTATPAWCPELHAARLALARSVVAAADDVLCSKCGKPVTTADEKSYRMHSMAGCPR